MQCKESEVDESMMDSVKIGIFTEDAECDAESDKYRGSLKRLESEI